MRLLRDNRVIYEGKIGSLRRFKDDVSEVKNGFECGIGLDRYQDIKVGDIIEVFATEKVAGVPELRSKGIGKKDGDGNGDFLRMSGSTATSSCRRTLPPAAASLTPSKKIPNPSPNPKSESPPNPKK